MAVTSCDGTPDLELQIAAQSLPKTIDSSNFDQNAVGSGHVGRNSAVSNVRGLWGMAASNASWHLNVAVQAFRMLKPPVMIVNSRKS